MDASRIGIHGARHRRRVRRRHPRQFWFEPPLLHGDGATEGRAVTAPVDVHTIRAQGDLSMYSSAALRQREALRKHPAVVQRLERFWHAFGARDVLHRDQFVQVYKLICTALGVGHGGRVQARREWQRDLPPGRASKHGMTKDAFLSSLFEVVDLWTASLQPGHYAAFLDVLFERITDPQGGAAARVYKDLARDDVGTAAPEYPRRRQRSATSPPPSSVATVQPGQRQMRRWASAGSLRTAESSNRERVPQHGGHARSASMDGNAMMAAMNEAAPTVMRAVQVQQFQMPIDMYGDSPASIARRWPGWTTCKAAPSLPSTASTVPARPRLRSSSAGNGNVTIGAPLDLIGWKNDWCTKAQARQSSTIRLHQRRPTTGVHRRHSSPMPDQVTIKDSIALCAIRANLER